MRDIAAKASVSQSTVSRVLNDAPTRVPIAADTRERVIEAARELGYRPNPLARALRGAPTNLMGAVVRDFSDPFFANAIETLAVEAMANGYNVVLGHAHGRLDESIPLSEVLETRHTDAIILLGDMQDQPRLLADLRASQVPVVALWQGASPREFPTMDVDDRAGVVTGLEHLVELGHRRIAFVSAELPGNNPVREDAYVEFMRDRFGGVPEGYVQHVPNELAGGETALLALLELRGSADRDRRVDRSRGGRRAARRVQLTPDGPGPALGRGLRRPADRRPHGPAPDDPAHADRGDGRSRGAPRDRAGPPCRRHGEPRIEVFSPSLVVRESTAPPRDRS